MPITLIAGLTGLSVLGGDLGPLGLAYVGVYFLAFVHTGVWLPAHASWWLLIPSAASYPFLVGDWDRHVALRLAITAVVWVLTGELVAQLQTRQRATEHALRTATHRDPLTGLDNRRGLQEHLAAMTGGETVVILDLDHFKTVNDTRGHAGGDEVLTDFAAVLTGQLRSQDYAARYGGEEFVLVLGDASPQDVVEVLSRLRAAWAAQQPGLTFSSGYVHHVAGTPAATSLSAADRALYAAKDAGRNRDVLATAGLPGRGSAHR